METIHWKITKSAVNAKNMNYPTISAAHNRTRHEETQRKKLLGTHSINKKHDINPFKINHKMLKRKCSVYTNMILDNMASRVYSYGNPSISSSIF